MLLSCFAKTNQSEISVVEKQARGLGNSDRIQLKFGSYGIEVLENGPRIRVSNLYSIHDGLKITRTFAVVAYASVIEPAIKKEHDAIISGQSIGTLFKMNGWVIDKRHQYFGKMEASSDSSSEYSIFGGIGTTQPVVHFYSLFVKKNNSEFQYASIAEVHHPEYLELEDLDAIYGNEFDGKLVKNKNVSDFLEIVRTKMQGNLMGPKSK